MTSARSANETGLVARMARVVDPTLLRQWCTGHLGSAPTREFLESGYLSVVLGVQLEDGRKVVIKVRPVSARLEGCAEVHRRLFASGYPCPEPLTGAVPFGEDMATAEAFVAADARLPASGRSAHAFAEPFARLIDLAPPPEEVPSLDPSPPWTAWAHREGGLWPRPDDHDVDLNAVVGPRWVDDAGRRARDRLGDRQTAAVIGHGDWYAGNLRFENDRLVVVHDWDSVIADGEPNLVGFAAAVFPTTSAGEEATVVETEGFLAAYAAARGRRFSAEELEVSWAAGVWLRAFDSKKQHAVGQRIQSLSEQEAHERLRRAGAI